MKRNHEEQEEIELVPQEEQCEQIGQDDKDKPDTQQDLGQCEQEPGVGIHRYCCETGQDSEVELPGQEKPEPLQQHSTDFYNQNTFYISSIFRNKRILSTDIGDEPKGREEQKLEISRIIADIYSGVKTDLAIHGPPGTGKSKVVRYVTACAPIEVAWLSCSDISPVSKFQAAAEIARSLGGVVGKGKSTGDCLNYIRECAEGCPILIVIDEIDKLLKKGDDSLLLALLQIENISLFFISNSFVWQNNLDSRILSRLKGNRLNFEPYNQNELLNILVDKAEKALLPDAYDTELLEKIASGISSESGDARKAIFWLGASADGAEKQGRDNITLEDVEHGKLKMESDSLYEKIKKFPRQDQLLLGAFLDSNTFANPPSDIFPVRQRRKGMIAKAQRRTTQEIHYWFNLKLEREFGKSVSMERTRQRLNNLEMMGLLKSGTMGRGQAQSVWTIWHSDFNDKEWTDALKRLDVPLQGTGQKGLDSFDA